MANSEDFNQTAHLEAVQTGSKRYGMECLSEYYIYAKY